MGYQEKKRLDLCKKHGISNRMYALAVFTGYRRSKRIQRCHTALLRIQECRTRKDAQFYVGKKCAFVYKVCRVRNHEPEPNFYKHKAKYRVIWGKVTRVHGRSVWSEPSSREISLVLPWVSVLEL